jgi:hypothetical protein
MYQKSILNSRKLWSVLCLIVMLNMAGCAREKAYTVSETSQVLDELMTETDIETDSVSISESETNAEKHNIKDKNILKVLRNEKKYFNTEFQEYRYLKDYSSGNYMDWSDDGKYEYLENGINKDFKIDCWCEVDMDSDGSKEIVLMTSMETVLVLHSENDIVYCYAFPFRGMNSIKTDGSYACSGSAANIYIGKLRFVDGACYYDEMCADDELDKDNPFYRINKKNVSREEVKSFLNKQEENENVLWVKGNPISK